jgi:Mg2+/citrate symporter
VAAGWLIAIVGDRHTGKMAQAPLPWPPWTRPAWRRIGLFGSAAAVAGSLLPTSILPAWIAALLIVAGLAMLLGRRKREREPS